MAHLNASAIRGLDLSPKSVLYEGRFGRIFRTLPAADFGKNDAESEANLTALGKKLVAEPDLVKDGLDSEESGIPSAYTYFGQFVDHDLTFDPVSSLQRQNDPDALVNFRSPAFDLDSVYGRGPDDQPYLYNSDGKTFVLGDIIRGDSTTHHAHDLLRIATTKRAIIGDPRNDENMIVSQLQGLFLRFHNRVVSDHPHLSFAQVQQAVRFHYQWVVINDFLTKIVVKRVIDAVVPHVNKKTDVSVDKPNLQFFHVRNCAFMPLEFSAAVYRMGHSMVRPGYRLNDHDNTLQPIFPFAGSGGAGKPDIMPGLTGFRKSEIINPAIDWGRFIDLEPRPEDGPKRLQLAYRMDGSLVDPLGNLPLSVGGAMPSLAERNLLRGWRMRLPSGQAIARAMGVVPIPDEQLFLGKEEDGVGTAGRKTVVSISTAFADNCPLWVYALLEAAHGYRTSTDKFTLSISTSNKGVVKVGTPQLGDVGGRIVAETFAGLMITDKNSYWNVHPKFKPFIGNTPTFGLREFIAYAVGDGH
jgi:hypothetical protein